MRMVAGSRPVLVIVWEWHIGLAPLCGCSGALEYPTTNSCGPINKSLSLSLILMCVPKKYFNTWLQNCNKIWVALTVTVYFTVRTLFTLFGVVDPTIPWGTYTWSPSHTSVFPGLISPLVWCDNVVVTFLALAPARNVTCWKRWRAEMLFEVSITQMGCKEQLSLTQKFLWRIKCLWIKCANKQMQGDRVTGLGWCNDNHTCIQFVIYYQSYASLWQFFSILQANNK